MQMSSETDFDFLLISTTNTNIVYMKASEDLIAQLKTELPSIISSDKAMSDKFRITSSMEMFQHSVTNHVNEAYNIAISYDDQMSQMSIFFRDTTE